MPDTVCPTCNHSVEYPSEYANKMWKCPDCRTRFVPPAQELPSSKASQEPSESARAKLDLGRLLEWAIAFLAGAAAATIARHLG